jgi:hypothetical protein
MQSKDSDSVLDVINTIRGPNRGLWVDLLFGTLSLMCDYKLYSRPFTKSRCKAIYQVKVQACQECCYSS